MAETITIAGKEYPKAVVYGGGIAVVGIVGYAYFTREPSVEEIEAEVLVPEEPTGVLPFGGTQSGTFSEDDIYDNDQEWFSDALDKLMFDYGVADTPTAAAALDRYLANQPLTAVQLPMINFVINKIGPPPSGPRNIRLETTPGGGVKPPPTAPPVTPPATAMGRVSGLRLEGASRSDATILWNRVPGAGTYRINLISGISKVIHQTRVTGTRWRVQSSGPALVRNRPYRIEIWPLDSNSKFGPKSSFKFYTAK